MLIFGPMDQQQYLSEFGEILLFIIGGLVFLLITLFVSKLVRPDRPNPQKLSTYESGEEPVGLVYTQFNTRFYIVALIFLLFEVEIVLLFPWSTVFADKKLIEETNGSWGWFALIEMLIFIGLLAIGLAYAWVNGYLDWVKPDPEPTKVNSSVPRKLYDDINEKYKSQNKRS